LQSYERKLDAVGEPASIIASAVKEARGPLGAGEGDVCNIAVQLPL
jgi:hypothetical protein